MKLINRLPLLLTNVPYQDLFKALATEKHPTPPALCRSSLRELFELPRGTRTIYVTVKRDRPTAPRLQDAYLEFRYDIAGFLDIRHPWKGQPWTYEPTLTELDSFLRPKLNRGRRYFVYLEVD